MIEVRYRMRGIKSDADAEARKIVNNNCKYHYKNRSFRLDEFSYSDWMAEIELNDSGNQPIEDAIMSVIREAFPKDGGVWELRGFQVVRKGSDS